MISEFLALHHESADDKTEEVFASFARDAADILREYTADDFIAHDIEATLERIEGLHDPHARIRALQELVASSQADLAERGFGVLWSNGYLIAATWDSQKPAGRA